MSRFFAPGCDRSRIDAGAAAMEFAAAPVRRRKDRIAVADGRKRRRQIGQRVGDELHKLPFPLNAPIDGQHVRGKDDAALLFEELWPDDEIGDAGLVFDGDDHDAFGRAFPFPAKNALDLA